MRGEPLVPTPQYRLARAADQLLSGFDSPFVPRRGLRGGAVVGGGFNPSSPPAAPLPGPAAALRTRPPRGAGGAGATGRAGAGPRSRAATSAGPRSRTFAVAPLPFVEGAPAPLVDGASTEVRSRVAPRRLSMRAWTWAMYT